MLSIVQTYARLYKDAITGLPRATWILATVTFVHRTGTMVVPFLALYFTKVLGIEVGEIGWLLGLFGAGVALGAYAGGVLSDRIGAIPVQAGSLVATGVGFFALAHLVTFGQLLVGLPLLGFVGALFRPASGAALAASCPAGLRPQAFALYRLAINLGMGVGPAVGGFLAEIDFALLFPVDGCVCILSAVLLLGWTRGQGQSQKPTPAAEPSAPGAGAEALGTSPWGDRLFLLIAGNTFLMALISFQWLYAGPLFLAADYQFTESQIGLVLAINPVLIVLLEMVLVRKLRGKAPLPWIALSGLILACGIGLLPFGSGLGWVIMVVVLWTIAEMLESPLSSAFAANRAGDSHIGRYMGVYTLSFSLAQMFAPVLGLSIYHSYGSDVLWFGCAAIGLLSAGVVFVMSRR